MAGVQNNKDYVLKNCPCGSVLHFVNGDHPQWFDNRPDLFYMETERASKNTEAVLPEAMKVTDFKLDKFNYNL